MTMALLLASCVGAPPRTQALRTEQASHHEQASASQPASSDGQRLPQAGDETLTVVGYAGIPILQKALLWDGNGDTDQAGVKGRYLWHLSDRIALGGGLTAALWFPSGHDIVAGELEAVGRWYFHRGDGLGAYIEAAGGYVHATDPIPPGGTEWNYTFSFGPGLDVPIGKGVDFIGSAIFHHISNALGRENPRNPSQNEVQIYVGFEWRF